MDENLGYRDDELFEVPIPRTGKIGARLLDEGDAALGLRLVLPSFVAVDARDKLPGLACQVVDAREAQIRVLGTRAIATAVDLETGIVRVGLARDPEVQPAEAGAGGGLRASAREPVGRNVVVAKLELRERLALPWTAADHLVTLLLMDGISNRVRVKLGGGDASHAESRARGALTVWPPTEAMRCERTTGSPAIPSELGVALSVDRVVLLREGAICLVRGAFRLKTPSSIEGDRAVVAITLVLTGSVDPSPLTFPLQIPSYDPIDRANPPPDVTGYFTLDLLRAPGMTRTPQTHFVYAFSGETLAGPAPAALVLPDAG